MYYLMTKWKDYLFTLKVVPFYSDKKGSRQEGKLTKRQVDKKARRQEGKQKKGEQTKTQADKNASRQKGK
jgi:hypothetical protein